MTRRETGARERNDRHKDDLGQKCYAILHQQGQMVKFPETRPRQLMTDGNNHHLPLVNRHGLVDLGSSEDYHS